jgi:hypothetical protein
MQNTRPGRGAAAAREIVVAVPVELKHLVEPIQNLIETVKRRVAVVRQDGKAIDYGEVERSYEKCASAIERESHRCTLEALRVDAPQIEVHGELYAQVATGNGTYYTMTGPVEVGRGLYRKVGERNAKVVDVMGVNSDSGRILGTAAESFVRL